MTVAPPREEYNSQCLLTFAIPPISLPYIFFEKYIDYYLLDCITMLFYRKFSITSYLLLQVPQISKKYIILHNFHIINFTWLWLQIILSQTISFFLCSIKILKHNIIIKSWVLYCNKVSTPCIKKEKREREKEKFQLCQQHQITAGWNNISTGCRLPALGLQADFQWNVIHMKNILFSFVLVFCLKHVSISFCEI